MPRFRFLLCIWIMTLGLVLPRSIPALAGMSKGQLIYVPAYSYVYHGDKEQKILLNAILSIRNIDPARPIKIVSVDYYDTHGKLIRSYLPKPVTLEALSSTRYVVKESDTKGGSGASFLVKWEADAKVNEPIVESVMIGASGQQGISFTSRGRAIKKK